MADIKLKTLKFPNSENTYTIPQTAEDIEAASVTHEHAASDITRGTLPVVRGGTGVTSEAAIGLKAYPVGSIYLSTNNASPASLFGGTWEQLKDRFLLGAGSTYSAGSTGGKATHTLTVNEMPKHAHQFIDYWTVGAASGTGRQAVKFNNNDHSAESGGLSTSSSGGGQAHNNMPPYLAVYMWKRIV